MALEKFNLNLTGVKASVANAFETDSADVSVTGGNATVTAVTKSVGSAKLEGFGTLYANAASDVKFVADANMKSGAYSASMAGTASISTFDASKASAHLSLTTGLVSVNGGVLKAGSGNDTILVTTTASDVSVYGGKGADLFQVNDVDSVTIVDYSYAEGDKVSVADVLDIESIHANDGVLSIGSAANKVSVKTSVVDGLSKFAVTDGSKNYDYVGATTNAKVNYTAGKDNLVFVGDGPFGSAVIDASKAANASINATVKDANITLGGATDASNSVVAGIDSSDSSVVVDLGFGKDTVSVAAGAALTLKIGKADGLNSLGTSLDASDTLVFSNGKLSDVGTTGTNDSILTFGATSIQGAFASDAGVFNVQFGSGDVQKLAYSNDANKAAAYGSDVNYYLGINGSSVSVGSGYTDDVVLDMINNTKGINSVDVSGAAGKVDIVATTDASIKAAFAHKEIEWKFDLTANDSVKANYLDVASATGVDRIVLSDAKGNKDSVAGFKAGEDILVLSDVNELTKDTFTVANNTDVVLHNSQASIAGAFQTTTNFDVELANGTAKKVALTNTTSVAAATQKTTTVINQTANAAKVDFNITEATENNAAFVVDMTGTVSNAIDYLGEFTSIDATVGAANALIIGKDATDSIKVTGSDDYMAVVWAGANANAQISLSGTSATDAGNIIWTGALDGASSVAGFDAKDKLYVYGVDGLSKQTIADSISFNGNSAVYNSGVYSSMTINKDTAGADEINVMYMDSSAEGGYGYQKVAYTNSAGHAAKFATDVDVYIGTGNASVAVASDAVAEGQITAINLSNKGAGSVEEGRAYYKDIHNIDASASAGTFLLIGDNTKGAVLKGGVNGNAIWGGGNDAQTMTGSAGVADIFWFGSQDGRDTVTNFGTNDGTDGDAVFLYDATSIDDVQITTDGTNTKVVFKDTNSTLTLSNVNKIDDVKFMLNNADGGYDYYKYDSKTSAFVPQKA